MSVHLTGYGTYLPEETMTAADVADRSSVPAEIVREKMGLERKHVCPPDDDHVTDMCVKAAREALDRATVEPADVDVVIYHGSEYKDYVVWSAAANVAERLGAENAYATESYTLCAGAPVALRQVRAQLLSEPIDTALLVSANREEDLVDYDDPDTSFTFNFGSGACSMVVEADAPERALAEVHQSAATTDGSFSHDVVMPGGGSKHPASEETVQQDMHHLRVPEPESMKERLAPVSLPAFLDVADSALERSGRTRDDVDFAAIVHMKRSFHETLCDELGLGEEGEFYLDEYGHVQSVDQILVLAEADERDWLDDGDVVLFLAAGTGYTWAATVLEWRA